MNPRRMNAKDRKILAKYLVNYWESRGMKFSVPWTLQYLEKGMNFEVGEERFILTDNGTILGTIALLKYYEHVAEIRDEIWENNAAGSLLLSHLIKYAKAHKIRKIYSLALKDKIKFYKKHGFVREGIFKNHFKKGENVAVMSKFL